MHLQFKKYETNPETRKLKWAFYNHKVTAKVRKIEFLLTYEEWIRIWIDSGHLHERGRGKNKYCMARYGDVGPYAIGNVKIITNSENSIEGNCIREVLEITRQRMSVSQKSRKPPSKETRKKMSISAKTRPPNMLGKKHSEETKNKMSISRRAGNKARLKRIVTEETRQKMRLGNLGRMVSLETRQKIRESWVRRREKDAK